MYKRQEIRISKHNALYQASIQLEELDYTKLYRAYSGIRKSQDVYKRQPYGWYFCECARKVRNGGELAACVAELKQKLDCVEICLAAYSLKQMKKSGRVSAAAAVVGDLLGIRPIISLNAGVSKVESKVRGDAAVPAAMIKWVESRVDSMKDTPYMVAYTSSTAKRDELVKLCKKAFGHAPLIVFQLGGVVSANTGPDGIAIVYEGKPRNLEAYAPELP